MKLGGVEVQLGEHIKTFTVREINQPSPLIIQGVINELGGKPKYYQRFKLDSWGRPISPPESDKLVNAIRFEQEGQRLVVKFRNSMTGRPERSNSRWVTEERNLLVAKFRKDLTVVIGYVEQPELEIQIFSNCDLTNLIRSREVR